MNARRGEISLAGQRKYPERLNRSIFVITKAEDFVPYLANIVYQRHQRISTRIAQEGAGNGTVAGATGSKTYQYEYDTESADRVALVSIHYIHFGKITIVQGNPGEGKTTFALNLAARICEGERFGQENTTGVPLSIIYQTVEDGLSDTLKPRLEEAKADCSRVLVIDDPGKVFNYG